MSIFTPVSAIILLIVLPPLPMTSRILSGLILKVMIRGAYGESSALRYGYETPESFHKAFRRFHGVSPSAAQRSRVQLRYLNPLQIKVELTGGSIMDYTMEHIGTLTVLGLARTFQYDGALAEIPTFWTEYYAKGYNDKVAGCIGVCLDRKDSPDFTYLIGNFCEPDAPVPDGFEKRALNAHDWAKFRAVGPMPAAIQKVNRQIYTDWLPNNTEYDLAEGVNIVGQGTFLAAAVLLRKAGKETAAAA